MWPPGGISCIYFYSLCVRVFFGGSILGDAQETLLGGIQGSLWEARDPTQFISLPCLLWPPGGMLLVYLPYLGDSNREK